MGALFKGVQFTFPAPGLSSPKLKLTRVKTSGPFEHVPRAHEVPHPVVCALNGVGPPSIPDGEFVDMTVANLDLANPSGESRTLRVPNPKKVAQEVVIRSQKLQVDPGRAATAIPSTSRALKIENAVNTTELKRTTRELAEANKELSLKDAEIMELKRQMGTRDHQLRYSKIELIESQKLIQQKDEQLRQTYESLVTYAKERSDLREQLICVEQDLIEARDELHHWTSKLADLKSVIDSVDDDDEDLADDLLLQPDLSPPNATLLDSLLGTSTTEVSQQEVKQVAEREVASAVDLLKELQGLSEQLLEDAKADEANLGLKYD